MQLNKKKDYLKKAVNHYCIIHKLWQILCYNDLQMSSEIIAKFPKRLVTREFKVSFILVTSLFFLWGVSHSLLDVLNKHFLAILGITKARSGLVQPTPDAGPLRCCKHSGHGSCDCVPRLAVADCALSELFLHVNNVSHHFCVRIKRPWGA